MTENQDVNGQTRRHGHCLCGSVTFSAIPSNTETGVCHCDMCRRWSAGPFFAIQCDDSVIFESKDDLRVYRSSEWGERGFCGKCGTVLFWNLHGKEAYSMSLSAFDDIDNDDVIFTSEIFIDEKPDYFSFANDTKKMTGAEVFAMFMGDQSN